MTTQPPVDQSAILERRARVLSPTYRLFYEQPLQIVRAEGVWMYDAHGRHCVVGWKDRGPVIE